MNEIVIVDYDLGNTKSVINALVSLGENPVLTNDKNRILNSRALILPGVGSFPIGMKNLAAVGLDETIKEYCRTSKPILGICLGMQLFLTLGQEFGTTQGLALVDGTAKSMKELTQNPIRLPHIGWNGLLNPNNAIWKNTILEGLNTNSDYVYFAHTFIADLQMKQDALAFTNYSGIDFPSVIKKNNIYGCQFHPEKSGECGLKILKNFINISKELT